MENVGRMMGRRLLFSTSLADCRVDTFRAGGKGGQHQNKVESGVRVTHIESGAVGEGRDSRSQLENKRNAFLRMVETPRYKTWHRLKCARLLAVRSVDDVVDEWMMPYNLRIETRNQDGLWVVADEVP